MLFTSEDVEQFPNINNQYKRKLPMYVEFNIGTNQGSPLAEMLKSITKISKLGLDIIDK